MLSPRHIQNLQPVDLPIVNSGEFERGYQIFNTQQENEKYAKNYGAKRMSTYSIDDNGFKMCTITSKKVNSLEDVLKLTQTSNEGSNMPKALSELIVGETTHRRYVCYKDITDKTTECFVTIWIKRLKEAE